jgi:uncharacterized membrane protein required for colicin V production
MISQVQAPTGATVWQVVFLSFAAVLILFEVLRGWRRGIARQLARLGGLVCAYFAAFFGGSLLAPVLRPFAKMPDFALSALAGAILAFIIYAAFEGLGTVLFRRTDQHDLLIARLFFGVGGAILGLVFGLFFVWLLVFGIRSVGSVADASMRRQAPAAMSMSETVHPVDERRRLFGQSSEENSALAPSLADLKKSIESGLLGDAIRRGDVVPAWVYDDLGKIGAVASNPESAERFLSFPGARELAAHPKITALRDDRQVADLIAQGRFLDLLQNEKVIDAANDPDLRARFKSFDVSGALDYALKK